MSAKRKQARRTLRVVKEGEGAFREVIALIEAFLSLGFEMPNLQVGFVPSPRATKSALCPAVIITKNDKAFTYRLDNHQLDGNQAIVEERWRNYLDALRGSSPDVPRVLMKSIYTESRFNTEEARKKLRVAILGAGLPVRTEPPPSGHIGGI